MRGLDTKHKITPAPRQMTKYPQPPKQGEKSTQQLANHHKTNTNTNTNTNNSSESGGRETKRDTKVGCICPFSYSGVNKSKVRYRLN